MSLLLVLIGPHTQTLTLNIDWIKITITGLWRVARHCAASRASKGLVRNKKNENTTLLGTLLTPCDTSINLQKL